MDWSITSLKPINYIPTEAYSYLTDAEIRALYGYEPLKIEGVGEQKLLAEKLGVGGTQSLTAIISDPNLSIESKRATLELLFGLTPEDTAKLVPDVKVLAP